MVKVSLHKLHLVLMVCSGSPSEELDVKLIVSAEEGVGEDILLLVLPARTKCTRFKLISCDLN